jgi:hypothetical protein
LKVLVGLVTRLRAKRLKKAFNGLLQYTWAKVDFKKILNNKVEPRSLHKDWEKKTRFQQFDLSLPFFYIS